MEEKKKSMTKDEMIMELMELLKANGRPKQAADVFESAAYVDMLESKLDQMTNELVQMRKELQEMKEQQASKSLKETLSEMVDRAQARCQQMKEKLLEVKEEMHNKAAEIVKAVKQKGKDALNRVSEFFGVKKKLESIRENVREGIVETDQTLARIDGFGEGMRMANERLANSFRVLAGKEQVDYSQKEYAQSNVAVIRKPWEWQKKVYQNLELHLDAAIDKVDNLAKDVEIQKMEKKWDELYEQTHQESIVDAIQPQHVALVSEPEYEYGAEAFEAYMKGTVAEIRSAVLDGTTYYFLRLEDEEVFYAVSASASPTAVLLDVGDWVSIEYGLSEEENGEIRSGSVLLDYRKSASSDADRGVSSSSHASDPESAPSSSPAPPR